MSNLRQAAQQALEAMEQSRVFVATREKIKHPEGTEWYDERITALRAALAEPDSDYERGFVDGMNLQTKGSVDKAVNRIAEPEQEPVAWVPVTDALPKPGVIVLACYRNRLGNLRRIRARWIAAKTEECNGEFDWGEYDEEADCYWTPAGWYECIDNWDDYSSVAVHEGDITHWTPMPLDPYTAPTSRKPLTDEEIDHICKSFRLGYTDQDLARAIERAHGIGEQT